MAEVLQLDRRTITLLSHLHSRGSFAQNLFDNGQSVGPVDSTMRLLHISNKVPYSSTLERFIFLEKRRKGTKQTINMR